MATTLGTVGTAIAGFAVEDEDSPSHHKGGISQGTVKLITLLMLPISICMIAYALFTFYWRSEFIRRKQVRLGSMSCTLRTELGSAVSTRHPCVLTAMLLRLQIGFFDDKVGPMTVALVVEVSLLLILVAAVKDVLLS